MPELFNVCEPGLTEVRLLAALACFIIFCKLLLASAVLNLEPLCLPHLNPSFFQTLLVFIAGCV